MARTKRISPPSDGTRQNRRVLATMTARPSVISADDVHSSESGDGTDLDGLSDETKRKRKKAENQRKYYRKYVDFILLFAHFSKYI